MKGNATSYVGDRTYRLLLSGIRRSIIHLPRPDRPPKIARHRFRPNMPQHVRPLFVPWRARPSAPLSWVAFLSAVSCRPEVRLALHRSSSRAARVLARRYDSATRLIEPPRPTRRPNGLQGRLVAGFEARAFAVPPPWPGSPQALCDDPQWIQPISHPTLAGIGLSKDQSPLQTDGRNLSRRMG